MSGHNETVQVLFKTTLITSSDRWKLRQFGETLVIVSVDGCRPRWLIVMDGPLMDGLLINGPSMDGPLIDRCPPTEDGRWAEEILMKLQLIEY